MTDVHQTLRYGREKLNRRSLAIALPLLCAGLFGLLYQYEGRWRKDDVMWLATFGLGALWTAYEVVRFFLPGRPLLVLSPQGIRFNIEWVKVIFIPWHEIQSIDTIDVTVWVRGHKIEYPNVTAILISKSFYKRFVEVRSFLLRGPGWDSTFVPKGAMMQMALNHVRLPVAGPELREAVEARWRAFRGQSRTAVPPIAAEDDEGERDMIAPAKASVGEAMSDSLASAPASTVASPAPWWKRDVLWVSVSIAASLVGIAVMLTNHFGLWETKSQRSGRLAREEWAQDMRKQEEERRRDDEKWEEFWRDFHRKFQ